MAAERLVAPCRHIAQVSDDRIEIGIADGCLIEACHFHVELPEFERIRAREVTWSSNGIVGYGDGERLGPLPLTARALPRALTLIAGES